MIRTNSDFGPRRAETMREETVEGLHLDEVGVAIRERRPLRLEEVIEGRLQPGLEVWRQPISWFKK